MILLTGVTGTNGLEVAKALAAKGVPFKAMLRDRPRTSDIAALGGQPIPGDFDRPDTLPAAMVGCDRALLLSAVGPRMFHQEQSFIAAARAAGMKHIVKFSALGADPLAKSLLQRVHGQAEQDLEGSGVAWTHVRPPFFMQNILSSAKDIRTRGEFFGHFGSGRAAYVDVRDIAALIAAVLTADIADHAGKVYQPTGPAALSCAEQAMVLTKVLQRPVKFVPIPRDTVRQALITHGMLESVAQGIVDLDALVEQGQAATVTDDVRRVAGRNPRTFEQFVLDHLAHFKV
jgi:uncharacterized protein YbjT (DUF2867 family)